MRAFLFSLLFLPISLLSMEDNSKKSFNTNFKIAGLRDISSAEDKKLVLKVLSDPPRKKGQTEEAIVYYVVPEGSKDYPGASCFSAFGTQEIENYEKFESKLSVKGYEFRFEGKKIFWEKIN